ncbi:hypothetical protein CsSME_00015672 [Camellia sinensis var. sinensis]
MVFSSQSPLARYYNQYCNISFLFLIIFYRAMFLSCNLHVLQPHFRRPLFNAPEFTWSVEWNTFGDGFHYFFYILKKGQRSSENNGFRERVEKTSISLFHDELETEDFIFRTNIDEVDS